MVGKKYSSKTEFDSSKDEELFSVSTKKGELQRQNILTVKVMRYNDGEEKIQIYRESNEGRPLKVGRLSLGDTMAVLPLLKEAAEFIMEGDFPPPSYQKPLWNDIQVG